MADVIHLITIGLFTYALLPMILLLILIAAVYWLFTRPITRPKKGGKY